MAANKKQLEVLALIEAALKKKSPRDLMYVAPSRASKEIILLTGGKAEEKLGVGK